MLKPLTYESNLTSIPEQFSEQVAHEPAWLQSLRSAATQSHQTLGVPTQKNEEWKYTSLRSIAETNFIQGEPGPAVFDQEVQSLSESSIHVVMVNGRFDRNLSQVPTHVGLTLMSLRDALSEYEDLVKMNLGKAAKINEHPFSALNTACFLDGVFLSVKDGTALEETIEITHISSGSDMVLAPRLLILAGENSNFKLVERYLSDGDSSCLTIPVTEVLLKKHANVEHVRVQDESVQNSHIALWEVRQEDTCEYRSYNVCLGAKLGRTDQDIWIGGEHCVTRLDGVVVALDGQTLDNHTRLDHAVPNCNSFEIYKQVAGENGTVVFNGKIFVHQDAQKTDAEQRNQALLLSPGATINSKPQLEIFADDVKCTHGATVGQLEDDPLFYLTSRGIPKDRAEAILVYAFAADVIELITLETVREKLEDRLFQKLAVDG